MSEISTPAESAANLGLTPLEIEILEFERTWCLT
jgi:hypothetical protein